VAGYALALSTGGAGAPRICPQLARNGGGILVDVEKSFSNLSIFYVNDLVKMADD
jgi:hypothetical protein